jgi:hypothetical protein
VLIAPTPPILTFRINTLQTVIFPKNAERKKKRKKTRPFLPPNA